VEYEPSGDKRVWVPRVARWIPRRYPEANTGAPLPAGLVPVVQSFVRFTTDSKTSVKPYRIHGRLKEAETGSPHTSVTSQGGGPFKPTTESCRVILYGDRWNRSDLGFNSQASARCYFSRVSSREREGKLKLTPVFPKYRLSAVSYKEAAGSLFSRNFSKLPAAS